MMENYRKQTPLGLNTFTPEVASAVLFLASDYVVAHQRRFD